MYSLVRTFSRVLFAQVVFINCVLAQDIATNDAVGSYSWEAVKVILSLLVVLAIFYLLIGLFKKYSGINIKANSAMRVVGGLSLGGKDKVVILQTGEINILLGVSSAGITKLHEYSGQQLDFSEQQDVKQSTFGQQIEKLINNKKS